MKRSFASWGLFAAMLTSGCVNHGKPGSEAVVRDSAGIQIIEHDSTVLEKEWRQIPVDPVLQIGEVDGVDPYMFFGAAFGLRHNDGRIVVLDIGSYELRYFGPDGRHVTSAGGRGGGPGEIQVVGYGLIPDADSSVGIVDMAQIIRYDWAGEYIGSAAIDYGRIVDLVPPDFHASLPVFPTTSGHWFEQSESYTWTDLTPTLRQRNQAFFLLSPAFDRIDTLAIGAGSLSARVGRTWPSVPFAAGPQAAVGGSPSRIYITTNESFEIRQFNAIGTLERIIRIAASPELVSAADIDDWQARQRASAERRGDPASAELRIRDIPIPSTLPPLRGLRVDRLGRAWAQRYDHAGEPRRYLVIDTTGIVLGNVVVPDRFGFFDVGADYLLGTWRDDMDVEFVRVYRY